jgi:hypothetical protein
MSLPQYVKGQELNWDEVLFRSRLLENAMKDAVFKILPGVNLFTCYWVYERHGEKCWGVYPEYLVFYVQINGHSVNVESLKFPIVRGVSTMELCKWGEMCVQNYKKFKVWNYPQISLKDYILLG